MSREIYPLEPEAILHRAPSDSGVYMIGTPRRWVLVGDSGNVRQSLLEILNAPPASFHRFGPLSFASEAVAPPARSARRDSLVAALDPACASA